MRGIIDRIEENYVVCEMENGELINILKTKFNEEPHEGDMFIIEGDKIILLKGETIERKKAIDGLFDELFEK